jgi:formylglycine-generating enzyme required for sulfatase activity
MNWRLLAIILPAVFAWFLCGSPLHVSGDDGTSEGFEPAILQNLLGISMVRIPGGEFTMGADPEDPLVQDFWSSYDKRLEFESGLRPHRVQVSDFYLAETPVTNVQFELFEPGHRRSGTGWDDAPVVDVSWHSAVRFCLWLSEIEGQTYRLPTEAEWEYAARAGKEGLAFPWGTEFLLDGKPMCHGIGSGGVPEIMYEAEVEEHRETLFEGAQLVLYEKTEPEFRNRALVLDVHNDRFEILDWTQTYKTVYWKDVTAFGFSNCEARHKEAQPVKAFPPNAFGLYDLSCNVWQWVSDWRAEQMDPELQSYPPLSVNPKGPGSGEFKMSKGGGFFNTPPFCSVYARGWDHPANGGGRVGFRIALDPPGPQGRDFRPNFALRKNVTDAMASGIGKFKRAEKPARWLGVVQGVDGAESIIRYWRIRRGGEYYLELDDASVRPAADAAISLDGQTVAAEALKRGDVMEIELEEGEDRTTVLSIRATRK